MRKLWIYISIALLPGCHLLHSKERHFNVRELAGKTIVLQHDQNDFSLEYVGIQFNNPKGIHYKYILEGFHRDWVEVGAERIARSTGFARWISGLPATAR